MAAFTIDAPQRVIAILGNGLSPTGKLPEHVTRRLEQVARVYHSLQIDNKPLLITCGKWSFWNRRGIAPCTTEAEKMQEYLINLGVVSDGILTEIESEDTVGNALGLKKLLKVTGIKSVTVVCADFHQERAQYIFKQLLPECNVTCISTPGPYTYEELELHCQLQRDLLERQKPFIAELVKTPLDIEHLYDHSYYTNQLKGDITPTGITALGVYELSNARRK